MSKEAAFIHLIAKQQEAKYKAVSLGTLPTMQFKSEKSTATVASGGSSRASTRGMTAAMDDAGGRQGLSSQARGRSKTKTESALGGPGAAATSGELPKLRAEASGSRGRLPSGGASAEPCQEPPTRPGSRPGSAGPASSAAAPARMPTKGMPPRRPSRQASGGEDHVHKGIGAALDVVHSITLLSQEHKHKGTSTTGELHVVISSTSQPRSVSWADTAAEVSTAASRTCPALITYESVEDDKEEHDSESVLSEVSALSVDEPEPMELPDGPSREETDVPSETATEASLPKFRTSCGRLPSLR